MTDILYRADGPWDNLSGLLVEQLDAGQPVFWIAFSQTITIVATVDGQPPRTRQARPGHDLPGDGIPLAIEPPIIATGCGYADNTGYRSTRPLLVATAHHPDDITRQVELSHRIARELHADGRDLSAAPDGHPGRGCGVPQCPRTGVGQVVR